MKILYVMHINWQWIRQRPHVLAEALASRHDLQLLHFTMYHRSHRVAEQAPPFPAWPLWRVPERLRGAHPLFGRINANWLSNQLRRHVQRFAPDLIWVTHPVFDAALDGLNDARVVYDCMDDHGAFGALQDDAVRAAERRLVRRATLTVFSSQTLAERVLYRSAAQRAIIANNGLSDDLLDRVVEAPSSSAKAPVMGYFGTVSHWFDWPLVLQLLKTAPTARLRIAGPVERSLPTHPRIEYLGVLPHAALPTFAANCDVLLMPFVVTPLIEAVDPVKLYEYIAFGRPALAPRYRESERFAPHVLLYRQPEEAQQFLREALEGRHRPHPRVERHRFLADCTWSRRALQIETALSGSQPPLLESPE